MERKTSGFRAVLLADLADRRRVRTFQPGRLGARNDASEPRLNG